jgi:hypothetical protein
MYLRMQAEALAAIPALTRQYLMITAASVS